MPLTILYTGKRPPAALPPEVAARVTLLHHPALSARALNWTAPSVPIESSGVVFYSAEGVRAATREPDILSGAQCAWAVGRRTAREVEASLDLPGCEQPTKENFQGLLAHLRASPSLPRHLWSFELRGTPRRLNEHLVCPDTTIHSIPCYETMPTQPAAFKDIIDAHHIDWVVLTSPRGALAMHEVMELKGHRLAAIGPTTARAIQQMGLHAEYIAPVPDADALIGDVARLERSK